MRLDEARNSYHATSSDGETDGQRFGDLQRSKDTINLAKRKNKTTAVSDQIKKSAADVEPNLNQRPGMPSTSSDSKGLKTAFSKFYHLSPFREPHRSATYQPSPGLGPPRKLRSETTPSRREPQRSTTYQTSPEPHSPIMQRSETHCAFLEGSNLKTMKAWETLRFPATLTLARSNGRCPVLVRTSTAVRLVQSHPP